LSETGPGRPDAPDEQKPAQGWDWIATKLRLRSAELAALTAIGSVLGFLSALAQFVGPYAHSGSGLIVITLLVAAGGTLAVGVIVVAVNRRRALSRPLRVPLGRALLVLIVVGAVGGLIGYTVGQPAAGHPAAVKPGTSDTPTASSGVATDPPGIGTPTPASSVDGSGRAVPSGQAATSSASSLGVLHFAVTGSCTSAGGTLSGRGTGFTPGGSFTVSAWTPSGAAYSLASTSGTVAADGSVPWNWPCVGDPAGRYTTQLTDQATGRSTAKVAFTVADAPPSQAPTNTRDETTGSVAQTWTDYSSAGGNQGTSIAKNQTVKIACKVTGFQVQDGDTWWYKIASSPWNSQFYVSADAFYNNGQTSGSLIGTPQVDSAVPTC
jgi:hypothetical protein